MRNALVHTDRRAVLKVLGGGLALATIGSKAAGAAAATPLSPGLPAGAYDMASLATLPGKLPLIKLTYRPPNYETPVWYFSRPITPNDAFFVRYHLSGIPNRIDVDTWKLEVGGEGTLSPASLSFDDLQRNFEQVDVTAVCQCAGNRRGFSEPHVPGVQWGSGAMGNARWRGVRLKDVLLKTGLGKDVVEIVVDGADGPPLATTPDFVKSLPLSKAMDENTIIATQMNGKAIPHFNGFPARLIVPGWAATYWMKHLISVRPVNKPFEGFWVKGAYRIPTGAFPVVQRFLSQENEMTTPVTEMVVNSVIASPAEGQHFAVGQPVAVVGVAWDAGYRIRSVEISTDGGQSWRDAALGPDDGRFSFRPWSFRFTAARGAEKILAKATNRIGQTQVDTLIFNGAGYHNNVTRPTTIVIT